MWLRRQQCELAPLAALRSPEHVGPPIATITSLRAILAFSLSNTSCQTTREETGLGVRGSESGDRIPEPMTGCPVHTAKFSSVTHRPSADETSAEFSKTLLDFHTKEEGSDHVPYFAQTAHVRQTLLEVLSQSTILASQTRHSSTAIYLCQAGLELNVEDALGL